MAVFNIYEAKTQLSKLIRQVRAGREIIIADAGAPVAKLVPIERTATVTAPSRAGRADLRRRVVDLPARGPADHEPAAPRAADGRAPPTRRDLVIVDPRELFDIAGVPGVDRHDRALPNDATTIPNRTRRSVGFLRSAQAGALAAAAARRGVVPSAGPNDPVPSPRPDRGAGREDRAPMARSAR